MSAMRRDLPVPAAVQRSSDSLEIARIWIVSEAPVVSIRSGIWSDPAAWGILLADALTHIVLAHRNTPGFDEADFRSRVIEGFRAETG